MAKDNQEIDPVSIEEEIESVLSAGDEEAKDDETVLDEHEQEDDSEAESEDEESTEVEAKDESGEEEDSGEVETEATEETAEEDTTEDTEVEKLEAPEHWAPADREVFNDQTKEAQEWLLKRHKEMEGAMTRKSQELASDKRQYDAISDALTPYRAEFAAAGLDNAGAVRQLAHWHDSLKTGGKDAILQLAEMYNIDLTEDEEYVDPNLKAIKQELSEMKRLTAQQQQAAQLDQQAQLERSIDAFMTETDEAGRLKHPHFNTLQDEMIKLFNGKLANDLPEAYNKALALRPDLTPKAVETVVKEDQALKVKKAKKAATGIKSSGATKQKRAGMTLEEEIAAQL